MTAVRVIGVGNDFRGDDGAGLEVARRLRAAAPAGVEVLEHEGEPARLIEAWSAAGCVYVVDAVRSGAPAGTVHRFDVGDASALDRPHRDSTHALGVGEAVELARALGRLPERLVLLGIEGRAFTAGDPLSAEVARAAAALAADLAEELRREAPRCA